jgi:photosystem II stability/assembly factor-like uncharacterized protein
MKKIFLYLVFSLLIKTGQAQWQNITPPGGNINDVEFVNQYTGIAVGVQQNIGNCAAPCFISRTIDGGKNWVRIAPTGISTTALNTVDFVDENNGMACGTNGVIIRTADGGNTWTQTTAGIGSGFNSMAYSSANKAVAIGNQGGIRYTTNGGGSWTTAISGTNVSLWSISFADANIGYIGGSSGVFLKTTNGGTSWTTVSTNLTGSFYRMFFTTPTVGYVGASNIINKTIDGGLTWVSQTLPMSNILSIYFANENDGWVGSDAGEIAITHDAGQTWTVQHSGYSNSVNSVYALDVNTLYATGAQGLLIKSIDGGQSWKSYFSAISSEQFGALWQNKNVVWSCGKNGKIYRSMNAGLNWQLLKSPNATSAFTHVAKIDNENVLVTSDSGRLFRTNIHSWDLQLVHDDTANFLFYDAQFIDSLVGFACGGTDAIYKTSNGGLNWFRVPNFSTLPTGDSFRGLSFRNASIGLMVGISGVYKTVNGGLLWTYTPFLGASYLQDVKFVSDSIAYAAGTFGRLMKTKDGGNIWFIADSNATQSVDISSMSFINDSTGYFAAMQSQDYTIDGGKVIGSQSTQCLFNNWSMNAIDVIAPDTIGICTGGLSGTVHKLSYKKIEVVYTGQDAYCSGGLMEVGFHASGYLFQGSSFEVELSDASGSFANAVVIGTLTINNIALMPSGLVRCTIPGGTPAGSGYRVRVNYVNPDIVGPNNGYDITISNSITPLVSITNNSGAACNSNPITLIANAFGQGLQPDYSWTLNGNPLNIHSAVLVINTPVNGDIYGLEMTSGLGCANPQQVSAATYTLNIGTIPSVQAGVDSSLCEGSIIQLNGSSNLGDLEWSPAGLLNNDTIANPTYTVSGNMQFILSANYLGCIGRDTISINMHPSPSLSMPTQLNTCENICIAVSGVNASGYASYFWTPSNVLQNAQMLEPIACVSQDTWLTLHLLSQEGCEKTDSVLMAVYPVQATPQISLVNDTLFVNTNNNLIWYLNQNPIPGADTTFYYPTQTGYYSVVSTDPNGCIVSSDSLYVLISANLQTAQQDWLQVAPNPGDGNWTLNIAHWNQVKRIQLINLQGQRINLPLPLSAQEKLEGENLPAGIYFLEVDFGEQIIREKLVKK